MTETGPWPFVTRRLSRSADGPERTWRPRHHRKQLLGTGARSRSYALKCGRSLWSRRVLNWWIGVVFVIGSLLFVVASVLRLSPAMALAVHLGSTDVNAVYFAGSVPFSEAAFLQLFQAANAAPFAAMKQSDTKRRRTLIHWRPYDVGWLSRALQFAGSNLFNFNAFDAMIPSLSWFAKNLVVWIPNIFGSKVFLLSGYLALIETCHTFWSWQPTSISRWEVFTNLLGCVGFMIAAVSAVGLTGPTATRATIISVGFTLQEAVGCLAGSLLMLPEAALSITSR